MVGHHMGHRILSRFTISLWDIGRQFDGDGQPQGVMHDRVINTPR